MEYPALIIIAVAAFVHAAYVTTMLVRADALTQGQLWTQLAVIWLLPVLGSALCHWFFKLHGTYEKPRELKYPEDDKYTGVEQSAGYDNLVP